MTLQHIIAEHYNPNIQMSAGQIIAIGSAIRAAAPGGNVLIFGCGNDSVLWSKINSDGFTLFLEDDASWIEKVRARQPDLTIAHVSYGERTVENSMPIDEDALAAHPVPPEMQTRPWDVIVIDAPRGHKPWLPGRSLPIYWSAKVALPETHVFIDDYSRRLERAYGDRFFRAAHPWCAVVPRLIQRGNKTTSSLLWVIGTAGHFQDAALAAQDAEAPLTKSSASSVPSEPFHV
jgi:hypothetical protein